MQAGILALLVLVPAVRDVLLDLALRTQVDLVQFVEWLNEGRSTVCERSVYFTGEKDGVRVEIALNYNDSYESLATTAHEFGHAFGLPPGMMEGPSKAPSSPPETPLPMK